MESKREKTLALEESEGLLTQTASTNDEEKLWWKARNGPFARLVSRKDFVALFGLYALLGALFVALAIWSRGNSCSCQDMSQGFYCEAIPDIGV